jgi:Tol biopolymer transport system component
MFQIPFSLRFQHLAPFLVMALLAWWGELASVSVQAADLGPFEGLADVGKVKQPGTAELVPAGQEFRMTAAGENVWGTEDAFSFAWRKGAGDLILTANVRWVGEGKNAHRKAGWMVRQGLEAEAPYADAVVHGDGLISLQYRRVRGGPTAEVRSPIKAPATIRLERHGDLFSLWVARPGAAFQPAGAVTLRLTDPVYAGLLVCSHEVATTETALFSGVTLQNVLPLSGQKRVRESFLEVVTVATGERKVVHRAHEEFEAPNWSPDGKWFYFNQKGRIYTLPVEGGKPRLLDTGDADGCNNDHGLSPDGKWLAISHNVKGTSLISIVPSGGGTPRRITAQGPSYWHGWSPDGKTLAYCARRNGEFDVYTIPVEGGKERRLTEASGLDDGPDYTPDGKKIYWNSERTGLMKIWRMNADGTNQEQVTTDPDYADWFPHPSPDGKWLVFLSYDKSVKGHPANQDVVLRLMPLTGGKPRVLATLFGGQGTINVPSWSPDSKQIAFVSYRQVIPSAR